MRKFISFFFIVPLFLFCFYSYSGSGFFMPFFDEDFGIIFDEVQKDLRDLEENAGKKSVNKGEISMKKIDHDDYIELLIIFPDYVSDIIDQVLCTKNGGDRCEFYANIPGFKFLLVITSDKVGLMSSSEKTFDQEKKHKNSQIVRENYSTASRSTSFMIPSVQLSTIRCSVDENGALYITIEKIKSKEKGVEDDKQVAMKSLIEVTRDIPVEKSYEEE